MTITKALTRALSPLALLAAALASPSAHAVSCNDGTAVQLTPSGLSITDRETASRFLDMATYGARQVDVDYLAGMSIDSWLDEQYAYDASCHWQQFNQNGGNDRDARMQVFWKIALTGRDQLRQRIALALSEIWVVSEAGSDLPQLGLVYYYDVINKGAFTGFRGLIERVATTPVMGRYLSMLGNQKADESKGIRADENFARELMQLFTIGLIELQQDGTPKLDSNGDTIPTYTQADIENLARILTGWNFAGTTEANFNSPTANWTAQMTPVEAYHDTGAKTFLGVSFPAGQSAQADLTLALNTLFQHRNVAPFISKQLIQRLVTSNPSPDYVKRVSKVFRNNGAKVRGDMWAVVKAILTDPEALNGTTQNAQFGKLREPLLALSHLWRATGAYPPNGVWNYAWPDYWIGQAPLTAPSVFNWFRPNYEPPGELKEAGLYGPEFQMMNDASTTRYFNELYSRVYWNHNAKADGYDPNTIVLDTRSLLPLAQSDVPALVDKLSLLLLHGEISADERDALTSYLLGVPLESGSSAGAQRVTDAIYLIVSSPTYMIFR